MELCMQCMVLCVEGFKKYYKFLEFQLYSFFYHLYITVLKIRYLYGNLSIEINQNKMQIGGLPFWLITINLHKLEGITILNFLFSVNV